ncbi:MAG: hypothetical protein JSU07_11070, partial [Bacteroidetes bacterium]|nr:hypothetical protein [Bacteroidota bacterium]
MKKHQQIASTARRAALGFTPPHLIKSFLMACIGLISVNVNAQSQNWWRVNGNTPSSSDFLGTSNSSDLIFKTNNQTRFVIDAAG